MVDLFQQNINAEEWLLARRYDISEVLVWMAALKI